MGNCTKHLESVSCCSKSNRAHVLLSCTLSTDVFRALQKQVLPGRCRRVEQLHLTRVEFTIQKFIQKFLALALVFLAGQLDFQMEFKEVESYFYSVHRKFSFEVF